MKAGPVVIRTNEAPKAIGPYSQGSQGMGVRLRRSAGHLHR
jgi:hypothetical protein